MPDRGCTTAVEDGRAWAVHYAVRVDSGWTTRQARVTSRSAAGSRSIVLEADGVGGWRIDGESAPYLDGCLDVDLEASAMTNALPVRRMNLPLGGDAAAPAAYLGAPELSVERPQQRYLRLPDDDGRQRYDYAAPSFEFEGRLVHDESGLVLAYPGLATRVPVAAGTSPAVGSGRPGA